jgi:hypothetical protein
MNLVRSRCVGANKEMQALILSARQIYFGRYSRSSRFCVLTEEDLAASESHSLKES